MRAQIICLALMSLVVIGFLGIAALRIWPRIKADTSAADGLLALS